MLRLGVLNLMSVSPFQGYLMKKKHITNSNSGSVDDNNYVVESKSFRPDIQKPRQNGKCCEGYIVPSMVRLMYQLKSVLK